MTAPLRYGEVVSIDIPDETNGRKSLIFKSGAAGGATIGSQNQAGQKGWTIVSGGGQPEGASVRYGDLIWLKAADNSGYLTWSRDNSVSVVKNITSGSAWAIQRVDGNVSSDEIQPGDTFVLGSMIGPCLARKDQVVKIWGMTLGGASDQSIIWAFHLAGSPTSLALRYGNMISLGAAAGANQVKRVAALSTYVKGDANQNPNDVTRAVTFDGAALADSNRWTILNPDDLTSTARVRFGDIVCLSASRLRDDTRPSPSSYYLSYRNDHLFGDGHRKIGVVSAVAAWERWRIVMPGDTLSELYGGGDNVKFEDTFALKAESGNGEYLSRPDAGGVSSSSTLTEAAKWTAENVFTAVDPKVPDPPKLQTSSDNSAAALSLGSDAAKAMAKGLAGALGKGVGVVLPAAGALAGPALEGLVTLFWPPTGSVDIWELIKSHVEALVNEKIQDERIKEFGEKLDGIKALLNEYRDVRTPDRRRDALLNILSILTLDEVEGIKLGDAQLVLPYQVILGTLHISALHEMFLYGPQFWDNYQDAETDRQKLKDRIKEYSDLIVKTKAEALEWRKKLIDKAAAIYELNPDQGNKKWSRWKITDQYVKSNGYLAYWDYDIDAALERYTRNILEIFGQQLDDFLAPYFLWRYMDPDCDEVPMKRVARTVAGPFGLFGEAESDYPVYAGDVFFYDPKGGPLTEISLTNGDIVYAIRALYGGRGDWHGSPGDNRTVSLGDSKIVKAEGKASWSINTLRLTLDKASAGRSNIEAGRETSGDAFKVEPPSDTDGFLAGVSGFAKDTLDTLYLHWQYTRWE